MSDEPKKPPVTPFLSRRAPNIAAFVGAATGLLGGAAWLVFVESVHGTRHVARDAWLALWIFSPACAIAAVIGTALVIRQWSRSMWISLPLLAFAVVVGYVLYWRIFMRMLWSELPP
jgi:hypothetical protein